MRPVSDKFRVPVPAGVQVVPRTDGGVFFINTTSKPAIIKLIRTVTDRMSGRELSGEVQMKAYGVLRLQ